MQTNIKKKQIMHYVFNFTYVSLEHSQGIFVAIDNNTSYGSKLYICIICQKSLDIKIMFHEDILHRNYIKT